MIQTERVCEVCGGAPDTPALNKSGEPCPCRCHPAAGWVQRTFTVRLDVGTYGKVPDNEEIAYLLRMGGIDAEAQVDPDAAVWRYLDA